MAQLQPNIMIMDGFYQNRRYTGTIAAKNICIDLISRQSRFIGRYAEHPQASADPLGKGFLGMGDAWYAVFFTEHLNPIPLTVGNNADENV